MQDDATQPSMPKLFTEETFCSILTFSFLARILMNFYYSFLVKLRATRGYLLLFINYTMFFDTDFSWDR